MTRLILAAVALLGLSELAPARAQFGAGPFYPPRYGYGYGYGGYSSYYRSGFGFSVGGPNFRVSGFAGGFVTRSAFVAPPVFAVPVAPFGPFGPVGFAPPGFGFNPFWGGPVVAVPVPVPVPVFAGDFLPGPNAIGAAPPPPRDDAVLFPKVARGDDFVVIAPRADFPPAPVPLPLPLPPPKKAAAVMKIEVPDPDPKKEALRLLKLGRASFAEGDYGRAAEHFERAAAADPPAAVAYFLHGQAKFAAGQYADAAARIREGLARDPKWALAPFDPIALYGDRPERFVVHLVALKKAETDNPGRVTLEFLLGYQLWYTGEKVEANRLFRAAEARLPEPGPLALFRLP